MRTFVQVFLTTYATSNASLILVAYSRVCVCVRWAVYLKQTKPVLFVQFTVYNHGKRNFCVWFNNHFDWIIRVIFFLVVVTLMRSSMNRHNISISAWVLQVIFNCVCTKRFHHLLVKNLFIWKKKKVLMERIIWISMMQH